MRWIWSAVMIGLGCNTAAVGAVIQPAIVDDACQTNTTAANAIAADKADTDAALRCQISTYLRGVQSQYGVVGYAVEILVDGQPFHHDSGGKASLALDVPVTRHTVFSHFRSPSYLCMSP